MRRTTSCKATVYDLIYYDEKVDSDAMKYGRVSEPLANETFCTIYNKQVEECGIVIDSSHNFLAASPGDKKIFFSFSLLLNW